MRAEGARARLGSRPLDSAVVSDCPNCGTRAGDDADLCPECGFDLHTAAADEVRRLREEGRIRPGRLDPRERATAAAETAGRDGD